MKLDNELTRCGCHLSAPAFRHRLEELKAATSPSWTVDDLVCHPNDAIAYCDHVRADMGCSNLEDFLILKTLMNNRKAH